MNVAAQFRVCHGWAESVISVRIHAFDLCVSFGRGSGW